MSKHKKHPLYCLCCGKKVDSLISGKYCSAKCSGKAAHTKKGDTLHCNNCGTEFKAIRKKSRFCPDCAAKNIVCICFYPKCSNRIQNKKIPKYNFDRRFVYVGTGRKNPIEFEAAPSPSADANIKKTKRPRKNIKLWSDEELLAHGNVAELSAIGRERGFDSYGKFTAHLMCKCAKG